MTMKELSTITKELCRCLGKQPVFMPDIQKPIDPECIVSGFIRALNRLSKDEFKYAIFVMSETEFLVFAKYLKEYVETGDTNVPYRIRHYEDTGNTTPSGLHVSQLSDDDWEKIWFIPAMLKTDMFVL